MMPSSIVLFLTLTTLTTVLRAEAAGKVLDINEKLPEFVNKHPDKSWLIKFYASWCYHCQQLEPIYNNVAETIYHKLDNLVVGRVDCTKSSHVCEKYAVDSYPTIIYINKDTSVKYKGDRSETSMVAFADRLQGPDVNSVRDCNHLQEATNKHGLVVMSNIVNSSDEVRREFESLAKEHKSDHWFYYHIGTCKDFLHEQGLYLLKRHLNKPIKFIQPVAKTEVAKSNSNLRKAIVDWMNKESFPVYGQVSYRNFERVLGIGKLLVIAVLDEYKPARRVSASSYEFHKSFEKLARKYAQYDTDLIFGWSSDIDLIEYITISPVSTPNVLLLKPDLSFHLLVDGPKSDDKAIQGKAKEKLRNHNIRFIISEAKDGKLNFVGGNIYLYVIMRYTIGNFNKFLNMYRANPLLVSLIFGFPSLIIIFVVYTTCFYEGHQDDEREDEFSDDEADEGDESRRLLSNGHMKQE